MLKYMLINKPQANQRICVRIFVKNMCFNKISKFLSNPGPKSLFDKHTILRTLIFTEK